MGPLALGTLSFYSSAFGRGTVFSFRHSRWVTLLDSVGFVKAGPQKVSVKRQCSAAGWWIAHSLTAGVAYRVQIFRLEPGPTSWVHTDQYASPTRSVWRFHVPRIWIRSINACNFPVKRKTLNVVERYTNCLFVVVRFLILNDLLARPSFLFCVKKFFQAFLRQKYLDLSENLPRSFQFLFHKTHNSEIFTQKTAAQRTSRISSAANAISKCRNYF